jgi:hypothetical protein
MTCDDYRSARIDGHDSPEAAAHAAICAECRSSAPALDEMRAALADPSVWATPAPELEDAVVAAIVTSAASPPELRSVPPPASTPRPPYGWLLGAAAVVVAGIAVGILGGNRPDWRIEVPGTDIAPEASATLEGWNTESGTRMRLHADGLPPAPDGFVYEMWFTKGEVHVSGGTFRAADPVELKSGVRRADFPRVWVTLEALDDDESPNWDQNILDTGPE